ncbi:hypothetical protein L4C36_22860 [Photobacterium japonica]|uniref:hypothetical protein n=1 Tax=Photobacterium japonica TaxID=2910235 RepID=UPI003D098295
MISETYIKEMKEEINNSPLLFQWKYTGFTGGKYNVFIQTPVSLFVSAFIPVILYLGSEIKVGDIGFWFCLTIFCVNFLISRFLFFSDLRFEFHVTQYGIHYTTIEDIPDIAYKIVRGIAWLAGQDHEYFLPNSRSKLT